MKTSHRDVAGILRLRATQVNLPKMAVFSFSLPWEYIESTDICAYHQLTELDITQSIMDDLVTRIRYYLKPYYPEAEDIPQL